MDPISATITAIAAAAATTADTALAAVGLSSIAASVGAAVGNAILALGFQSGLLTGLTAWSAVASVAGFLGSPKIGSTHDQTQWKADPYAAIPYVGGRTGYRGLVVYEPDRMGDDREWHHTFTCFGGPGPYEEFESFSVVNPVDGNQDDPPVFVTFNADGEAQTAPFKDGSDIHLWVKDVLGTVDQAAMTQPPDSGPTLTTWTAAHRLRSLAASWMITDNDPGIYETGDTYPPMRVIKGGWWYDPSKDDTYPGGAGDHRWADPVSDPTGYEAARETWEWSENPWLWALNWALGIWTRDPDSDDPMTLVQGIGARMTLVDVPAYVYAAGVAEANDWKAGGVVFSADSENGDSKWQALIAMAQAGGGKPLVLGGKLSCWVQAPRVSIATLTRKDFVGETGALAGVKPRRDRYNQVFPTYRSEDHGWQPVTAIEVTVDDYVTADRGKRPKPITYSLVQDVNQAAQLARYDIEDSRERGPFSLTGRTGLHRYQPGDCVTLDDEEFGLGSPTKVIILQREIDAQEGVFPLTFQSETDAKHALALAQVGEAPPV